MPNMLVRIGQGMTRVFGRNFFGLSQIPATMDAVDLQMAQSLLPSLPDAWKNRPYIEGDHFQRGQAWVGPGPKSTDSSYNDFLELLEPAFVSKNVIDEACDRLTGAVIGWEPRWAWVPIRHDLEENPQTDDETAAIEELESSLTQWWDRLQVHKLLKRMIYRMLWAKQCGWRLYVPAGLTDDNGVLTGVTDLDSALSKIYIDIPEPEDITVWEHPDTKKKLGIVFYTDSRGTERAEVCYLNDADKTVVRILPDGGATTNQAANDFGGHLTIYTVVIDKPLITAQVRSLQNALNMTLTLLEKGLVDNHFLERIFMNAMPPGYWTYEEDGKTRKAYVVDAAGRKTGGRTDSFIQGIDYQDPDGKTTLKSPSVTIRTPLDPNGTIGGSEYWYQTILEALRQDHVLINQLATPSGKSREHSRGDFIDSTKDPTMQADLAGRELLLTVVKMSEAFLRSPGKWTKKFKPVFKCRPNYGPLSVAERQQNIVEAEKGFLSDETVMALNGTDDVDAEMALIRSQPRALLALSALRAAAVIQWSTDFPREVALHLAGYTDKEIAEIMKRVNKAMSADPNAPLPEVTPTGGAGTKIGPQPAGGLPPNGPGNPKPGTNGPNNPVATRSIPPAGNRPSAAAASAATRG